MGGLAAAVRLARSGFRVQVLEARAGPGGLAASVEFEGFRFDAGPYILLDRPGLEWAFQAAGLDLAERVALRPLTDVYEVTTAEGERVRFQASLEETAAGMERTWPGSGPRYTAFVNKMAAVYRRLQPLQRVSRPGLRDLLRTGAWRNLFFLWRSLRSVLNKTGLPRPVIEALSIWTHVAGQRPEEAPSPLAFVPALIHTIGAFYPAEGIGAIPRALADAAVEAGATLRYGVKVTALRCRDGRVSSVETDRGEQLPATAVLSDASGIGTYLDLVEEPAPAREQLRRLPLQSPGVCAYLAVRGEPRPPYLRFKLPGEGGLCRLLIVPGVPVPELGRDGWRPARLMAPMGHTKAEAAGVIGQRAYLAGVLAEDWWREYVGEYRILAKRIPVEWGLAYNLYRDSMNPVMTARLMRAGRLAHRSPHVGGLYLAGSSTHPGQWVSFCAVSGVLAADRLREDLA
jgi:phytoene dehydrogenase-like protein